MNGSTFHYHVQVIGKAKNYNVVAASAYRHCENFLYQNAQTGEQKKFSYRNKKGWVDSFMMFPEHLAKEYQHTPEKLWNTIQNLEKRKDGQLARELQISLHDGLSLEQNQELLRQHLQQFVDMGMVADVAIHCREKRENGTYEHLHAHVLLTLRDIKKDGQFGNKNRIWNDQSNVEKWRKSWEIQSNNFLEKAALPTISAGKKENGIAQRYVARKTQETSLPFDVRLSQAKQEKMQNERHYERIKLISNKLRRAAIKTTTFIERLSSNFRKQGPRWAEKFFETSLYGRYKYGFGYSELDIIRRQNTDNARNKFSQEEFKNQIYQNVQPSENEILIAKEIDEIMKAIEDLRSSELKKTQQNTYRN